MISFRGSSIARTLAALLLSCGLWSAAVAQPAPESAPRLAIIIDDLGHQRRRGLQALALPGPVAMAFLPHTPFAQELASRAHAGGKEVLLHLPMQALSAEQRLEHPSAITLDHTRRQFSRLLAASLGTVPHVSGVNNHMGSLLTRHPGHMAWLMEELLERPPLFFIDSYTTHHSVALRLAEEYAVPALKRDVFLDRQLATAAMTRELERLKTIARTQGFAVGIGHPHQETLSFLARQLPLLAAEGFVLVPLRALLPYSGQQQADTWRAYGAP